ncbi:VWA domain-containing protein [Vibrio parahaemolyticus]|uniref:VWA domain-containing protein n=1 Tax=Vibrio parahaemolyticus TaxID=670 RepID=UPI0018699FAD|nr:VWA domain-containing protein [Vibrio parahaemolyticus]MBE4085655.1 VWA domain-containing protein [Vibrio parahaemolyticus]MCI9695276.1 VWA domain-containing protein [Vibrio parahaemolyticus]MCI9709945.1 VWA domain-containing protein [Vibrio parahaemolyticus]MCI9714816.1 VWA domain-containing protein [Vibrio parahaemolyticus]MCR9721911.1 VWA domain-containing protein [Vibrio parahaemolyticus]
MKGFTKQKGVAGIIFVSFLPILIITFSFSVGYTQRLLAHSKIEEAAEVASLALIASPGKDNKDDQDYAQRIVDLYITDNISDIEISVSTKKCEYKDGCVQRNNELSPFADFTVVATAEHDSWISHNEIGVEPKFKVSGDSITRKYLPQPVDIYFILDTSQSMSNPWYGERNKTQMQVVKDTITRVVKELENFKTGPDKKSRVALLTYNAYNAKFDKGAGRVKLYDYASEFSHTEASFQSIVDKMFEENVDAQKVYHANYYNQARDIPLTVDYQDFINILNSNKVMPARGGGTDSWLGLIAAAKEADKVKKEDRNPEQVFIFLSDGADTDVRFPDEIQRSRAYRSKYDVVTKRYEDAYGNVQYQQVYDKFLKSLVGEHGLCESLKKRISSKENKFQSEHAKLEGEKTKVTMGVIGVNYNVQKDDGFGECVGEKNIYHAKNGKDVYKYILNLINEETGRLKD